MYMDGIIYSEHVMYVINKNTDVQKMRGTLLRASAVYCVALQNALVVVI